MYPSKGGLDECDEDDKAVISKGNGIPTPEGMSAQQASSDWDSFERQSRIEPNQKKKMEIVLKIRNCLKEYGERNLARLIDAVLLMNSRGCAYAARRLVPDAAA